MVPPAAICSELIGATLFFLGCGFELLVSTASLKSKFTRRQEFNVTNFITHLTILSVLSFALPLNAHATKSHDSGKGNTPRQTNDTTQNADCEHYVANNYQALRNVTEFTNGAVGAAGTKPEHYSAYECVLASEKAISILIELIRSNSVPAQLYGLMGLYALAPEQYKRFKPQFQNSTAPVNTVHGCLIMQKEVGDVVKYYIESSE
jgi:hypothetical protein